MKEKIKDRLIVAAALALWIFVSTLAGWFTKGMHEIPISFLASTFLCAAILAILTLLVLLVCVFDQP